MVTHTTTQADERAIYPAYQPSGLEWLGEIPVGWDIWKATHAFGHIGSGTTPKSDNYEYYDGQIPWVTTSELRETRIDDTLNKITAEALRDYPALRLYPAGTLLFAMYGATIGRLGILKIPATVNQACAAFSEPIKLDPKFTYYWLYMRRPILIALSAGGGQPNLSQDDLKQLRIPAPPLEEQLTIADYLDRETTRIDALLKKKQKQIKLLQEKRTALISHAVTKGLDPNAKMKDSGVEWLGPVPEGWSISKLGFHASVKARLGWKGLKADEYVDEGFIFLSTPNIKNRHIDFDNVNYITKERYLESPEIMLEVGDVLIAKDGSTLGTTNVVRNLPAPATVNSSIAVLRPKPNLNSSFLYWIMTCPYTQSIIQQVKDGQGVPHLFQADLRKFRVWLPSYEEQRAIAAYLDHETAHIDALTEKVEKSITLLREYRTSLISAAVTGKIDVRKEAA